MPKGEHKVTTEGYWDSYYALRAGHDPIKALVAKLLLPALGRDIAVIDTQSSTYRASGSTETPFKIFLWSQITDTKGWLTSPPTLLGRPNPNYGEKSAHAPMLQGRTIFDPFTGFPLAELHNEHNLFVLAPVHRRWHRENSRVVMRYILWEVLVLLGHKDRAWLAQQVETVRVPDQIQEVAKRFSARAFQVHESQIKEAQGELADSEKAFQDACRAQRVRTVELKRGVQELKGLREIEAPMREHVTAQVEDLTALEGIGSLTVRPGKLIIECPAPNEGETPLTIELPLADKHNIKFSFGSDKARVSDIGILTGVEELLVEQEYAAAAGMLIDSHSSGLIVRV